MNPLLTLTALLLLAAGVGACDEDTTEYQGFRWDYPIYILSDSERAVYESMPKISMEMLEDMGGGLDSAVVAEVDTSRLTAGGQAYLRRPQPDTTSSGEYIYVWDTTYDKWVEVPDTTRFYAKVDTCLTCPDGWELKIHDTLYPYPVPFRDAERWCLRDSVTGNIGIDVTLLALPDTTLKTTWLPKVQRWFTPEEIKVLECVLSPDGHNFPSSGKWVHSGGALYPGLLPCTRCGLEPKQ